MVLPPRTRVCGRLRARGAHVRLRPADLRRGLDLAARAAEARLRWLKHAVRLVPSARTNTLIVTHTPNIVGAFGRDATGIAAGEMLVFRPADGGVAPLGRIRIEDWARLARETRR